MDPFEQHVLDQGFLFRYLSLPALSVLTDSSMLHVDFCVVLAAL